MCSNALSLASNDGRSAADAANALEFALTWGSLVFKSATVFALVSEN